MLTKKYIGVTALTIGLIAAQIIVLHLMGRIPWCVCGIDIGTIQAWSSETSQHLIDPYSLSHVLHGILFFAALWLLRSKLDIRSRWIIALLLEIAWEILENSPLIIERYRAGTAALDYTGDSILNSVGDTLSMLLGFYIAMNLSWKWTLALFVFIEIVLLYTIRDNLTLNIIMLLAPIEVIREWQLGHP